jgi:Ion channel
LPWQDNARVSPALSAILTVLGVFLILTALRDVFDTLFHPGGRAAVSRGIMRVLWRAFHPLAERVPRAFSLAGPTALIMIVVFWVVSLILGWALIFWPHIDGGFAFQEGAEHRQFIDSVYISMTTLATVGFGDITPDAGWLRVITPFEALLGFGLLTASIAWLGSIYPVLQRRRSLAYEIHLLREAQGEVGADVADMEPTAAAGIYSELMSRLVNVERDMVAFPIAYYFTESDDRFSLPAAMCYLNEVALHGSDDTVDERARLRAIMLRDAIGDFAQTAAKRFHKQTGDDTRAALRAYARDHLRDPDEVV